MNKLKTSTYYNEFVHSTKELDSLNKVNKEEEFRNKKQIKYNDMPSSEEMLSRVKEILNLCENKSNVKKSRFTKPRKFLLVAVILTFLFGVFSISASGNLYKFFCRIINIDNAKYVTKENISTVDVQDYSKVRMVMTKLDFIPVAPRYLPNGLEFINVDPIVSKEFVDLYFAKDNLKLTIREKKSIKLNTNIGSIADTENSKEKFVNVLGKDVIIYSVDRGRENNSLSFSWSMGDMQYSIISNNIEYNEIIKVIESLYYLE